LIITLDLYCSDEQTGSQHFAYPKKEKKEKKKDSLVFLVSFIKGNHHMYSIFNR